MFTARYGLGPYITQISFVFKEFVRQSATVWEHQTMRRVIYTSERKVCQSEERDNPKDRSATFANHFYGIVAPLGCYLT